MNKIRNVGRKAEKFEKPETLVMVNKVWNKS